jgi:hypothetical protein
MVAPPFQQNYCTTLNLLQEVKLKAGQASRLVPLSFFEKNT